MTKRSVLFLVLAALLAAALIVAGCAEKEKTAEEKTEIVFGAARSYTGPLAIQDQSCFGPVYRLWIDEVNAAGGIYVEEYGKKLPIRLLKYDDTSDMNTMTNLLTKLIVEDQVDFILAPISTAFLKAAAQICNEHNFLLIGAEGGAKELEPLMKELPYFFSLLNYATHQVPPLAEMLAEHNIKTAAIIYIEDQHGLEYKNDLVPALEDAGIEVVFDKAIPMGVKDVSSIIEEAKSKNVQALLCCAYPDENFAVMNQCIASDYNPDVLLFGPGACFEVFYQIYGENSEGVMGWGAWNEKSSDKMKDLAERLIAHQGERNMDWWGMAIYYAGLEALQQAIERAGTLDHEQIRDILATEKFDTVIGELWFENGGVPAECYPGHVGQWQNGIFEVVAPKDKQTNKPIIPKPKWKPVTQEE
ncbi:MAG: ABC transporter substrate-binding protein [Firmicutes bacterium]|jgi:branched-chain amino acid transport system substrate-binding protein|nr:ABC transporter substrate-binding protein [Bacillota bacterium]HPU02004.1 amino acid ABC transporter substrate-binding protein [Bacillota bacterium]